MKPIEQDDDEYLENKKKFGSLEGKFSRKATKAKSMPAFVGSFQKKFAHSSDKEHYREVTEYEIKQIYNAPIGT
mgnify:FL=1